jgi:glycosyltransferase involved in cell wall biosynthesis
MVGGTEIQTLNLVQALVHGGHKVVTLCYFEHDADMVSRYQSSGCTVVKLNPSGKRISGIRGIPFLYKGFKKILKAYQPDVVHVQYMAPGAIPIFLLRILGVKNILATAHTAADIYPNLRLVHFIQQYCVRAFTCITQRAEESFFGNSTLYSLNTILKKRNHFTIYNALPVYIQMNNSTRNFNSPITLGVVSRLEKIKGMDLVIPAFAQVKRSHSDVKLIVVGDGSLRDDMMQQAKDVNVHEDIVWAGRQKQDRLQSWYEQIDILLMPSRSEGFGLTAIEAMACGCVVVASDTGGLPEIVQNKIVGLLHQTVSIEDIAAKTTSLIEDKWQMQKFSMQAKIQVTQYGMSHFQSLISNLYLKI